MEMPHYWDENPANLRVKYEGCNLSEESNRLKEERSHYNCCDTNLNFSTATCSEDDSEFGSYKKSKMARQDPMSHRIIEKRRRDRMNNCLADLSRLIPTEYLKKGRGRIEKTEIIEMAIKHMKFLQQEHGNPTEQYRLGYQECMSEAMRFMVEKEGRFSHDAICVRLLNHLQKHCASLSRVPPSVLQTVPSTDIRLPGSASEVHESSLVPAPEYQNSKNDAEPNNNNIGSYSRNTFLNLDRTEEYDHEHYDKHSEINGLSYKYKTNIKMRFTQDLNSSNEVKKPKLENVRRTSVTSLENHSSSHSSPPSSDVCTRISESENLQRSSPTDSTLSMNTTLKIEHVGRNEVLNPFSPQKGLLNLDIKNNFNIPIFVLHPKGSYYIPLTIDYKTLVPFLLNYDLTDPIHNIILHPVTINVNFQPAHGYLPNKCKYENPVNVPHSNWS